MDGVNWYCDALNYNRVTWFKCDDDKIVEFRGYPDNVYDELLHENEQNQGKIDFMKVSDKIVSMLYIKETLSHPELTHFYWVISI